MAARDAVEVLRENGLRVTPQRRAILETFRGTAEEHLSAEEVLSRAGTKIPEIGRGTVYAALAELTEIGLLASVGHVDPIRYEINLDPHDHFYCRLCLRMFDMDLGGADLIDRTPPGYSAEQAIVRVEGVCVACREFSRGLGEGARSVQSHETLDRSSLSDLTCVVAPSVIGDLGLAASGRGITRVAFADHADFDAIAARARRPGAPEGRARLQRLDTAIQRYLGGESNSLTGEIDWHSMAPAPAQTLRNVTTIPYGEHRSYEQLGSLGPYEAGWVMGTNPIPLLIPCHRVRSGSHRPETYVGGAERLQFLRRLEDGARP